ncbi:MAG: hypothetical protein ACYC3W_10910 [Candidatus Nanopelagicales bacterium]
MHNFMYDCLNIYFGAANAQYTITIPLQYQSAIQSILRIIREMLAANQELPSFAALGSTVTNELGIMQLNTRSNETKDEAAMLIKTAARELNADFVICVMNAWALTASKLEEYDQIMEQYGSIAASPYALDVVFIVLETAEGTWTAQETIQPLGESDISQTIGEPVFSVDCKRTYCEIKTTRSIRFSCLA